MVNRLKYPMRPLKWVPLLYAKVVKEFVNKNSIESLPKKTTLPNSFSS